MRKPCLDPQVIHGREIRLNKTDDSIVPRILTQWPLGEAIRIVITPATSNLVRCHAFP